MQRYIQLTRDLVGDHKQEFKNGTIAVAVIAVVAVFVALFAYNNQGPNIVYQPVKACDLLTPVKAEDLLGDKVVGVDRNNPVISGNTAVSKCSYGDENPDRTKMMVAAVAVRSAINDLGVKQNKADFTASKTGQNTDVVDHLGDDAYFNKNLGQLNVLSGRQWYILSLGAGESPASNSVDKEVELAHIILK